VAFVVVGVERDAVPTRWEDELGAQPVRAVLVGKRRCCGPVDNETREQQGGFLGRVGVVAVQGVARDHAGIFWERDAAAGILGVFFHPVVGFTR
jgi:hypothetical protein